MLELRLRVITAPADHFTMGQLYLGNRTPRPEAARRAVPASRHIRVRHTESFRAIHAMAPAAAATPVANAAWRR
jgi:hypothetical protein